MKHTKKIYNELLIKFQKLDKIEKSLIALMCLPLLYLLIQNFILSSYDVLILRGVDDYAFHHSIRKAHNAMLAFRLADLIELYDYGYGWLFWFIHIVLTFPFFLIAKLGFEMPIISLTRDISLFFSIGTAVVLFKIVQKYSTDKYLPYIASALYISFPYFAYASLSFRTISQTAFFSLLTYYLAIRNDSLSKKDLKFIAISLAAAIGTKLSAILLSPLIALILLDRFNWKLSKESFRNALYFLKFFVFFTILFLNPSLFLAPFKWKFFTNHFNVLLHYIEQTGLNTGANNHFSLARYDNAIVKPYVNIYIFYILVLGLVVAAYQAIKAQKNKDFLLILIFLAFIQAYLFHRVKLGDGYITNYFFSYSAFIILGIVAFDRISKRILYGVIVTIFLANIVLNREAIAKNYNMFFDKYSSQHLQNTLVQQNEMQNIVGELDNSKTHSFLIDYRAPMIYSSFRENIQIFSIFDNLNQFKENPNLDYILLHRDSKIFESEEDLKNSSAEQMLKSRWIESHFELKKLMSTGEFAGRKYLKLYDQDKLILYKSND